MIMWLYEQESIKESYHPAKFGGHRHCGSVYIIFLVVTWPWLDGVTSICLINLISLNYCRYVCLPNLVVIGLIETEISILRSILTWIPYKKLSSIHHIARFLKSGIPIYNSEVLDRVGRNTRRRRTQAVAKLFVFHANAIKMTWCL